MSANRVLHIDFECFNTTDLKKVGLANYVAGADFMVTVIAWAFDQGPVRSRVWPDIALPMEIRTHIEAGGEVRAHNAMFEQIVLVGEYGIEAAPEQFVCTMQKALAYGLPGGLLKAGLAIRAPIVKDESKRLLMLSMSRPRRDGSAWHTDPVEGPPRLAELQRYCEADVEAERALDRLCPDLAPFERELSLLDNAMNRKGVRIDGAGALALLDTSNFRLKEINAECGQLTQGVVTSPGTQTAKLMGWLETEGCPLADLSKKSVAEALADPGKVYHDPTVRRVLELRQEAAKASVAKLGTMLSVMTPGDERARFLLQFYGAGRTGRWAGRLVQPQNLPRTPKGFDAGRAIRLAEQDVRAVEVLFGTGAVMDTVSKSLRGCFVAAPGKVLVSVDLSQIEARVLAWLAGQADVVEAFRRGEDVYVLAARKVGSGDRQLGKVLVLACGFGMGAGKFWQTANEDYGVKLTQQEALDHLRAWRSANAHIVAYWKYVEDRVRASLQSPGTVIPMTHGMAVRTLGGVTQIRKPNGVKLTYHDMREEDGELVFSGVNSKTKAWGTEKAYGGRLVENLTQSVARDIMGEAGLRVKRWYALVPVMTVHDELMWEAEKALAARLHAAVDVVPAWAAGLPVASEVSVGWRYAK